MTPPARVLAYVRVSTSIQAQEGFSLAAQQQRIATWAAAYHGVDLPDELVFKDAGMSGRNDTRPGLEALLLSVRPGDTVVVVSLSRLSRSGAHQTLEYVHRIREAGGRLVSLTENIDTESPSGRLVLTLLASMAEMEIEQAIERSEAGRLQSAFEGHAPIARLPYGYRRAQGATEVCPERGPVAARIFRRRAEGASYLEVANELNAEGIPAPRGATWYLVTVMKIVQNEAYKGEFIYRKKEHPHDPSKWIVVPFPPLVDPDIWQAAQGTRSSRNYQADPSRYPLTGHLVCRLCGSAARGKSSKRKNRTHAYYICRPETGRCGSYSERSHLLDVLHDQAREQLARALTDPADPARLASLSNPKASAPDPNALERRKLELQIETLTEMRLNRELGPDEYKRRRGVLESRLADLAPAPLQLPSTVTAEARQLAAALALMPHDEFARWLDVLEAQYEITSRNKIRLSRLTPL